MRWSECNLRCCLWREKMSIIIVVVIVVVFWCTQCYDVIRMFCQTISKWFSAHVRKTLKFIRECVTHSYIHKKKKKKNVQAHGVPENLTNILTLSFMFPFSGRKRLESKVPNVNAAKNWSPHFVGLYTPSSQKAMLKGRVQPKMKLLLLFTHPHIVPNLHTIIVIIHCITLPTFMSREKKKKKKSHSFTTEPKTENVLLSDEHKYTNDRMLIFMWIIIRCSLSQWLGSLKQDSVVAYELLRFNSAMFWEAFTALLVCEMIVLFLKSV